MGEGEYLVPVKDSDSGLYGYYDLEGNLRSEKIYTEAYTFCNGRTIVKYKDSCRLIDTDCKTVYEFTLSLNSGEYISSATGDVLVVSKESEDKTEFSYAYRVGKGKILTNESGIISARVMTSGDICVQTAEGTYGVYDNTGGKIFENSQNSDIMFEENAGVYRVFSGYTDEIPYYRIISKDGSDIVTAAYNKYCEIGNGCFCCINEDIVTIYTANGIVLNTITAESTISDTYSDNGVIFITDKNGGFKAYTYLGEEIL